MMGLVGMKSWSDVSSFTHGIVPASSQSHIYSAVPEYHDRKAAVQYG
jgi:hypothetical protein